MIAGTLEIQMLANLARLQSDMDQAKGIVGQSMRSIEQAVDLAKTAFVALAGVASVGAFAGMIKDSIEGAARLHDLAIQTGATVEALSGLASIGKFSGQNAESIGNAMNKLAKNMAGATEDTKGTGQALQALNITFGDFKNLSPDQQMVAVSKAMDQFADGSGKAAVAMALYGKEGAKMLPFLKDLAIAGEIQAKVTTAQARMADDFSDNLIRLKASGEAWKKELALGLLPAMNLGVQAFIDVTNGTNGLRDGIRSLAADGSLKSWAQGAITAATYVIDAFGDIKRVALSVGMTIGGVSAIIGSSFGAIGSATGLALKGDFAGALEASREASAQQKFIWSDLKSDLAKTWTDPSFGTQMRARMAALDALGATAESVKPKIDFTNVLAKNAKATAIKAESDAYGVLLAAINKEMEVATQQIEQQRALTASEKFRIETLKKIEEEMRKGNITMEQAIELESAMHDAEGQRATADYLMEKIKMTHELYLENLKLVESYEKTIKGEADQSKALKLEIEMMALTLKGQAELTRTRGEAIIVTKQMELASIKAADAETGTMSRQQIALAEEIRLMQERNGLLIDKAALQQSINNFKTAWESVDRTAHDVFVSVAENGSNAFKKIGQTLKSAVLDLLYQMTLKKWLFDITASATGTATGVANAATGGVMSAVNGASSLNSIYGAGSQALYGGAAGSSSAGLMYANGVGMVGGDAIGALAAANGQWAGVAGASSLAHGTAGAAALEVGGTTAAGGGITSGLASVPVYGWIALAAIAAYAVFSKESKPSSSTGDAAMAFDAAGKQISKVDNSRAAYKAYNNPAYDNIVTGLQADYASKAKALGIGAVESGFGFAGNTGKGGEKANIAIIGQAGNSKYESGEVEKSDANMQLLAARAVFAALQGSDLPKFLKGSFDGLVAGNMQTADIANAITGAQALKGLHDNVLKMPFAGLADLSYTAMQGLLGLTGGVQGLTTGLASYYNNYYSAAEKTAATTKQVSEALAAVNVVMPKTREEFRAQMDAAIALGDAGAPTVAALLSVENAFAGIAPAVAGAAGALVQMQAQLQSKISNVIADYASSDEVKNFQANGIKQTLAGGGVNLSVAQILSATRADARALYDSYAATGNTAAQSAILDAAKAFATLTPAVQAQAAQANAFGAGSSGGSSGGAGLTSAVSAMTTAANNIVSAMQSLTQSLLVTGGPDGVARLEAQFAIEVAQAKAGDLAAAQDLPALSKLLADAYKTSSESAVEQSVNTARIVQSLGTVVTANGGQVPNLSTSANGVNTAGSQQLAMLQQQFSSMTTQLATIVRNTGSTAGTLTAAAQGGQPLMTVATV